VCGNILLSCSPVVNTLTAKCDISNISIYTQIMLILSLFLYKTRTGKGKALCLCDWMELVLVSNVDWVEINYVWPWFEPSFAKIKVEALTIRGQRL